MHFEQRLDVSLGCDRLSLALFRPSLCSSFVALGSVVLVPSRSWGGLGRSELLDGRETLSADMLLEPLSEGFESLGNPGEESVQPGEVWMGEREGRGGGREVSQTESSFRSLVAPTRCPFSRLQRMAQRSSSSLLEPPFSFTEEQEARSRRQSTGRKREKTENVRTLRLVVVQQCLKLVPQQFRMGPDEHVLARADQLSSPARPVATLRQK